MAVASPYVESGGPKSGSAFELEWVCEDDCERAPIEYDTDLSSSRSNFFPPKLRIPSARERWEMWMKT